MCHGLDAFEPFPRKDELYIIVTVVLVAMFCFIRRDMRRSGATLFIPPTCSCLPILRVLCKHYVKPWLVSSTRILYGPMRVIISHISVNKCSMIISTSTPTTAQGWFVGVWDLCHCTGSHALSLMLCCCSFKLINHFWTRDPHFHSALWPASYCNFLKEMSSEKDTGILLMCVLGKNAIG